MILAFLDKKAQNAPHANMLVFVEEPSTSREIGLQFEPRKKRKNRHCADMDAAVKQECADCVKLLLDDRAALTWLLTKSTLHFISQCIEQKIVHPNELMTQAIDNHRTDALDVLIEFGVEKRETYIE
jgi:hypothetical protein